MDNITIIKSRKNFFNFNFREIYQYRELFWVFVVRDVKVRYKQTIIGVLWAIIQPLLTMIVFSFFFGKIAGIDVGNVPYPLFSYAGLTVWILFTNSLSQSSQSLIGNNSLISKVYFPRIIIPLASTLVSYVDYLLALSIFVLIMAYFQYVPPFYAVVAPIIGIGTILLANGIGFFLSALNVQFRDIRFALPFFIQLLIFASPVIYPAELGGKYQWIVQANPMTGYLEAHRSVLLGNQPFDWLSFSYSLGITFMLFILGYLYFSFVQRKFADII